MNESERLAIQLDHALNGGAWHGPSWREVLDGVSRPAALHRPLQSAHNIAEIVLHTTTWHEVVRRRLEGESPQVSEAEDWPAVVLVRDPEWSAMRARLLDTGRSLCDVVRRFPVERLHEHRPGMDETWFDLIIGELQHLLYHEGQVGLLRKAALRLESSVS